MWENTSQMKYDTNKHLYTLDLEHVKNTLGIDFVDKEGSDIKARDTLFQISRTVYNWIYSHTHYIKQMEFWLAMDEEIRPIIQWALEEQARYEFEMSAEYLAMQSGINVVNGIQIPLDRLRGWTRIAPEAENILRNNRLLYQGQRFMLKREFDYESEGY